MNNETLLKLVDASFNLIIEALANQEENRKTIIEELREMQIRVRKAFK